MIPKIVSEFMARRYTRFMIVFIVFSWFSTGIGNYAIFGGGVWTAIGLGIFLSPILYYLMVRIFKK